MLISLAEYAAKHGKSAVAARKMAQRGGFATARKIGSNWVIDDADPWPDHRIKSGKYIGWRKPTGNPPRKEVPRALDNTHNSTAPD